MRPVPTLPRAPPLRTRTALSLLAVRLTPDSSPRPREAVQIEGHAGRSGDAIPGGSRLWPMGREPRFVLWWYAPRGALQKTQTEEHSHLGIRDFRAPARCGVTLLAVSPTRRCEPSLTTVSSRAVPSLLLWNSSHHESYLIPTGFLNWHDSHDPALVHHCDSIS